MKKQTGSFAYNYDAVEHVLASEKNIAFWIEESFLTQVAKTTGQKHCFITALSAFSFSTGDSFAFQKDSEFLEIFNNKIKKIKEGGLHFSIKQSWVKLPSTGLCAISQPVIDIQKTILPFLLLIIGFILSSFSSWTSNVHNLMTRKEITLAKLTSSDIKTK